MFKEGYIRTAWEEFSIKESDVTKQFIHLTNNAIQKNADKYGKYEDGNQLSFKQLEKYIKEKYDQQFSMISIINQIKETIIVSIIT